MNWAANTGLLPTNLFTNALRYHKNSPRIYHHNHPLSTYSTATLISIHISTNLFMSIHSSEQAFTIQNDYWCRRAVIANVLWWATRKTPHETTVPSNKVMLLLGKKKVDRAYGSPLPERDISNLNLQIRLAISYLLNPLWTFSAEDG